MDGIFINGRRPTSKKQVKDAVATAPETVRVEFTDIRDERTLPLLDLALGTTSHFVGPDPYTNRKFYGTLVRARDGSLKVS